MSGYIALIALAFAGALGLVLYTFFAGAAGPMRKLSSMLSGFLWMAAGTSLILTGHGLGMAGGVLVFSLGLFFIMSAGNDLREGEPSLRQRLGN